MITVLRISFRLSLNRPYAGQNTLSPNRCRRCSNNALSSEMGLGYAGFGGGGISFYLFALPSPSGRGVRGEGLPAQQLITSYDKS